jgi:hypothetical protein
VFGSEPNDGQIFIAERSRKGSRKLPWSVMPEAPIAADAGMRAGVSPQWANSAQITSPGPRLRMSGDWPARFVFAYAFELRAQ